MLNYKSTKNVHKLHKYLFARHKKKPSDYSEGYHILQYKYQKFSS